MADKKVYVLDAGANQYEAMTKEEIMTAITQAVNDGTISNIDAGFITKIQEMNKKGVLKWWVGTQAEFNAIDTKDANTLYLFTDDPLYQDLLDAIDDVDTKINGETTVRASQVKDANDSITSLKRIARHSVASSDVGIGNITIIFNLASSSPTYNALDLVLGKSKIVEFGLVSVPKLFYLHLDISYRLDFRQSSPVANTLSLDLPFSLELGDDGQTVVKTLQNSSVDSSFTIQISDNFLTTGNDFVCVYLIFGLNLEKYMETNQAIGLELTPCDFVMGAISFSNTGSFEKLTELNNTSRVKIERAVVEQVGSSSRIL